MKVTITCPNGHNATAQQTEPGVIIASCETCGTKEDWRPTTATGDAGRHLAPAWWVTAARQHIGQILRGGGVDDQVVADVDDLLGGLTSP